MSEAKKTSLFNTHKKYGGKIIDFAGWALPVEYEGIIVEHNAVRNAAGIFDVSHMGEIEVKGRDAHSYVQNLVTNDIAKLVDYQIMYTFMCYPHGGIVDDLLVYRFSEDEYYLVVNASNIEKDHQWMLEQAKGYEVEINNLSSEVSEIALQGPKAEAILQKLTTTPLSEVGFFYCRKNVDIAGVKCMVSRTGYTGEDGFEIYLNNEDAPFLWDKIMEAGKEEGIKPAGLGARDTLRFEALLPLYGNELSQDITPLEAGFKMFVKLNKNNFIGLEALREQEAAGLKRKLVAFEMEEKGIPRHDYPVLREGRKIGIVTTGYLSPTLNKYIGLALIETEFTEIGTTLEIQVRKRTMKARVIKKSFYQKKYKK